MNEDTAREDIAFIRRTIEQGRRIAGAWSPDMLVWGIAIAIGYFGTYARVRGWWTLDPNWLWVACIVLPWLYSLRRVWRPLLAGQSEAPQRPLTSPLTMVWFACGIFLTILAFAAILAGERATWGSAVTAGVMGIGFFVSSSLCNLAWMRWVAIAWWVGELAMIVWHGAESLLLMAALMLMLLALPGFVLMRRRGAA
ncbi:MAG TPA: hypothetical protein VK456_10110 [Xanthobacteraceae bacterium]|nr:hypothetical protein [Xanthobacteraceae bacterium]